MLNFLLNLQYPALVYHRRGLGVSRFNISDEDLNSRWILRIIKNLCLFVPDEFLKLPCAFTETFQTLSHRHNGLYLEMTLVIRYTHQHKHTF